MIYKPPYGVAEGGNWWPGESIYAREARQLVISYEDEEMEYWESSTQVERNKVICNLEYPKMLKRTFWLNKKYDCFADTEALPF